MMRERGGMDERRRRVGMDARLPRVEFGRGAADRGSEGVRAEGQSADILLVPVPLRLRPKLRYHRCEHERGGRGGGERSACACFRLQNPRRCGVLAAHGWAPAFSTSGAENCGSFFGQRGNLEVRVSLLSRDALRGKASSQRAHASRSAGPSTMLPSASKKASIAGSSPMLSHSCEAEQARAPSNVSPLGCGPALLEASIRCHRPRTLTTSMADTLGPDARRSEALQKVRVAAVDAPTDDAVVGAAVIATLLR